MLTMRRWQRQDSSKEHMSPPLTEAVKLAVGKPKKGWRRLQKAIKSQPDMNQRDASGFTAMLHAARFNLPGVIHELAEAGANVNLRSDDGNTPFHYACFREHWNAMDMLIRLGADPDAVDTNGRTPLIRAIECQDEDLVTKLLEFGASPQACGENDVTPLFAALSLTLVMPKRINTCIVQRLLDAGSNVNLPNSSGSSPLTFVCLQHRHSMELIELLLQRGATVNVRDAYGRTPLTHCLRTGTSSGSDCLALILKAGADTNVVDADGHTSLSIWALDLNTTLTYDHGTGRDHNRTLKQLLACGANPNIVSNVTSPNSLMQTVVRHGRYDEARALLAAGAEAVPLVKSPDEGKVHQRSALITALLHGNLQLAKLLADGLFYTQKEINFLSRLYPSKNKNLTESIPSKGNLRTVSSTNRLIRSRSRPDMLELYESYGNLSISSLCLDSNANVTKGYVRRSPSADALLNFNSGSTYKLSQSREMLSILSNDPHAEKMEKANVSVLKRSQSRQLDVVLEASVLQLEPEQKLKLDQPKSRELIEELCYNVPSLQKLCRRSVHRALRCGVIREEIVKQLPIWPNLHRYLLFQLPEHHPCLRLHSDEIVYV